MPMPPEEQLIKEAQEIDDPYLVFWQKVELLRRYYHHLDHPNEGVSWEQIKKQYHLSKKVEQNVIFNNLRNPG
jgi:hypothetical protein